MAQYEIQVDEFPADIRPDRRSAAAVLRQRVYERISDYAGRDTQWGWAAYRHGEMVTGAMESAPLIVGECFAITIGDSVKNACPLTWWRSGAFTARKRDLLAWAEYHQRDLLAWAEYHQRECADFYALAHDKPITDPEVRNMVREVLAIGQAFPAPA